MNARWQEWSSVSDRDIADIKGVCFDVDDTFSTEGQIRSNAFQALWKLHEAGFGLVPVTGRPAGWCDHFSRFWPVNAVVGENGAFVFFMEGGARRRLDTPSEPPADVCRRKLEAFAERVRDEFPHVRWSSDQQYREFDLAIDVYEDVPDWPDADVERLLEMAREEGAHAKLSSVHVNVWFGSFDKFRGFTHWRNAGSPGLDAEIESGEWIYMGDSPNDAPMFAAFERSVGVANVRPFRERIGEDRGPRWVTGSNSGDGFVEVAERLLSLR